MESKKAKKTPMAQTPKSAKKNDKSVKTPVSKGTPMADTPRPVLSAKKQNGLQAAGKATPNKKGNATPNKKTPKSVSKKKAKKPEKKVEEEEEEDDEEDDDSEIELNPEILKSLAEMSDDEEMSDDDEEMSDDDDDEDDDDEDDDDDDGIDSEVENEIQSLDEEQLKQLIKSLKGKEKKSKNGVKETAAKEKKGKKAPAAETPKKENKAKAPAAKKETPAPKAAKKETKEAPAAAAVATTETSSVSQEEYIKSVSERDLRTLFLKGLPVAVQEEDIMKLSKDIKSVRIRKRIRRNHKHTACYAFVEFENESAAEKNFKLLSETVLEGKTMVVDYMGAKSQHRPKTPKLVKELDPKKLYITGFPYTTTDTEIRPLFTKAESFVMPVKRTSKKPLGFAFAKYENTDLCSDEMKRLNGMSFKECKLVVVHANVPTESPKSKGVKRKTETTTGKAKKMKLEKKKKEEEEEDDDEEEEDDDEEEEEDDDDDDDDDEEEEEDDDDDE